MKNMRTIVLFCLLALVMSQASLDLNVRGLDASLRGEEFDDPEFVKVINNYFGCKTW